MSLCKSLRDKAMMWNVFDSRSTDPLVIRRQLISTRVYVVLIISALAVLTTYSSVRHRIEQKTVLLPTEEIYHTLHDRYADSLRCPCTKVAVPYGAFVHIRPVFHQVCTSDFVSQAWIDFVFPDNVEALWPIDVRMSLSAMWQLIRTFCESSTNATAQALDQLLDSTLITSMAEAEAVLTAKAQTAVDLARERMASNVIQTMMLVHEMTRADQLVSGLLTNYYVVLEQFQPIALESPPEDTNIYEIEYYMGDSLPPCSCKSNDSCPKPGSLYLSANPSRRRKYHLHRIIANETLPGLVVDCLPIQTTLSSSLDCFYNRSCLGLLLSTYPRSINVSVLHASRPSRFRPSTPVEQLLTAVFLEDIHLSMNFSGYYEQCSPSRCTYLHVHRFNWLVISTTLIGLLGGLTAVLRFITPLIVQMTMFVSRRLCRRQQPDERAARDLNLTFYRRVRMLWIKTEHKIFTLSIYDRHSADPRRVHRGTIATRFYLITLVLSTWMLTYFIDMSPQLISKKHLNPSPAAYEQLERWYESTLVCPCTEISIPYRQIIDIRWQYHQLCTSGFVQPDWYQYFHIPGISNLKQDFVSVASSHFQALSAFCRLVNLTVHDANERFLARNFVNTLVIPNRSFHTQIDAATRNFVHLTKINLHALINFTAAVTHSNQYLSRRKTSTHLLSLFGVEESILHYYRTTTLVTYALDQNGTKCYCVGDPTCAVARVEIHPHGIVNLNSQLLGIFGGCSVVKSVLRSSLICWFESECLKEFGTLLESAGMSLPSRTETLDPKRPSRYRPDTPFEHIFSELLIEQWDFSYSFEKFFEQCKPSHCSYTYQVRASIIYMITAMVTLFGGVSTALKLLSPHLIRLAFTVFDEVKQIRSARNGGVPGVNVRLRTRAVNLLRRAKNTIQTHNIFDNDATNVQVIRRQRISTWIYLLLLTICLSTIAVHAIFLSRVEVRTFDDPLESDYRRLLASHEQSLECPCKRTSIRYKHLLAMNATMHTLCASDRIVLQWRDVLSSHWNVDYYGRRDLRVRGSVYFSLLAALCDLAKRTVTDGIDRMLGETFFSTQVMSRSKFDAQVNDTLAQFQKNTVAQFVHTLQLLRGITHGNGFVSSYELNWFWRRGADENIDFVFAHPTRTESGCSCATRSDCVETAGVYFLLNDYRIFSIPGWMVGCSTLETLLRSTLECFHDQNCIDSLLKSLNQGSDPFNHSINITALRAAAASRFQVNTTVEDMVQALFVEQWHTHISYSAFFEQCAASSCSYEIARDDSLFYAVSAVLGLYGGLTFMLSCIVPLFVTTAFSCRNQVVPQH